MAFSDLNCVRGFTIFAFTTMRGDLFLIFLNTITTKICFCSFSAPLRVQNLALHIIEKVEDARIAKRNAVVFNDDSVVVQNSQFKTAQ